MSEIPHFTLFENIVATPDPADTYRLEQTARVSDVEVRPERGPSRPGTPGVDPSPFSPSPSEDPMIHVHSPSPCSSSAPAR